MTMTTLENTTVDIVAKSALDDALKASGRSAQGNGKDAENEFKDSLVAMGAWSVAADLDEWRQKNEIGKRDMTSAMWKRFGDDLRKNGLVGPHGVFIEQAYFKAEEIGERSITVDFLMFRNQGSDVAVEVKQQLVSGSVNQKMYEIAHSTPEKLPDFEFHCVYTGNLSTFGTAMVDVMVGVARARRKDASALANFGGFQSHETMIHILKSPVRSNIFENRYYMQVGDAVNAWDL